MTLVGTVPCPSKKKVLIGADTAMIDGPPDEPPFNVPAEKLYTSKSIPSFTWGYSGGQPVGEAFGRWLDRQTFSSWDQAGNEMGEELARLNGEAHARAELAGAGASFEGVEVLAVAIAFDEAHILYLDVEGGPTYKDHQAMFIGGGKTAATIGWQAAVRVGADGERAFRAAMETATEMTPLLGHPPTIREIPTT